ncbi:antizyme inhibitor 2-like [Chironomus tepperi]|uniref:antizyme inhibitor 2-like n=1 Tax=Chironomus tepperi TaxID=113505 RepID=UPI00391F8BD7
MDIVQTARNIISKNSSNGIDDPFYILNLEDVKQKYEIWKEKIPRVVPYYAVKCNDDERVLKLLSNLGAGFDCASKKEFTQILNLGVDPERIIYAHTAKQLSHLKAAADEGIQKMTFDCEEELQKIKKFHPYAKVVLRIRFDAKTSFVNLGPKFGCNPITEAPKLIQICKEMDMNLIGISFHVGTATTDYKVYGNALDAVRKLFDFAETLDMKLNFVDIGGGFMGDNPELFNKIALTINTAIDRNFPSEDIEIISEPGRYFVDTAFSVAAQVILKKKSEDGQIYYFINESTYLSFCYYTDKEKLKYSVIKKSNINGDSEKKLSTIWGCTCSSLDKMYSDIEFPELEIDDWIVFHNMGAYSRTISSDFNGFSNRNSYLLGWNEKSDRKSFTLSYVQMEF